MIAYLALLLALRFTSVFAVPQYGVPSSGGTTTSTPTTAADTSVQTILVASNGLKFTPNTLTVPEGGQVVFQWSNAGHSVTQGFPDAPCSPFSALSGAPAGFDSGIVTTTNAQWVMTVKNASIPIVFHCQVPTHCISGMFGVINPASSGTGSISAVSAAISGTPTSSDLAYATLAVAAASFSGSPAVGNAPSGGSSGGASSSTGTPSVTNQPNGAVIVGFNAGWPFPP